MKDMQQTHNALTPADGLIFESSPPYAQTIDIEAFRRRAKTAMRYKGMSYVEVGRAMGCEDDIQAANKVKYLVNNTQNPGIADLVSFCNVVQVKVESLLFGLNNRAGKEV